MVKLMDENEKVAINSPFYELCKPCGDSGSGFYINDYPPNIVTVALRLLYRHKQPNEDFEKFISQWGYYLIKRGEDES